MPHALIIDDDPNSAARLGKLVEGEAFSVSTASSTDEARHALDAQPPDIVLLDPDVGDGAGLLRAIEKLHSPPSVVMIPANPSLDTAVEALRHGVTDYLRKPPDADRLQVLLHELSSASQPLGTELRELQAEHDRTGRFLHIVGRSTPIVRICELVTRIAPTSASVLISGESGTGKDVLARTIHELSRRKDATFLPLNCGAISPTLMESELFGHEKGSFTGADRRHKGCFERASGGTLFLDEISEMPSELQVKLLRVLESGTLMRVGGEEPVRVDVRVLAATNRSVDEALSSGALREDLYFRLRVFQLDLPPLRERAQDIELLANHFLAEIADGSQEQKRFSTAALERLSVYSWPGNIRELKNAVRSSAILAGGLVDVDALPREVRDDDPPREVDDDVVRVRIGTSIREAERRLILATLRQHEGNKASAAEVLGVSLKTLYNRLKSYEEGSPRPDSPSARDDESDS